MGEIATDFSDYHRIEFEEKKMSGKNKVQSTGNICRNKNSCTNKRYRVPKY
jgi:hypothetical protein